MNLRYISLGIDERVGGVMYSSDFVYHTRFISNYFSKAIRKIKFVTDGTFDMISIRGTTDIIEKEWMIRGFDALNILLPFNKAKYEEIKGTEDCNYYLELLECGFKRVSKFKSIPLDPLLNLIIEFKNGKCKNEWLHKRRKFKEYDIEVLLNCYFTTNYFQLIATINQISTKKELVKGIVIKTKPDEIHFDKMYNDILIYDHFIVITDKSNSAIVLIDIRDAKKGIFNKIFAPYVHSNDYTKEENEKFEKTHNNVIEILSYDGNGFRKE